MYRPAVVGGLQLSLAVKAAHSKDQVHKSSASSNGVLKICKHTALMAGSRPIGLNRELRSHANHVQPSCLSFQRDHPFLDGTP